MKKILSVIGTRPNFIKIAPIYRAFLKYPEVQHLLCHTGQHSDDKMSKVFFNELGIPVPDFHLGINSGSHAVQTANIMIEFEKVLNEVLPDLVIVVGDVNSTVACAFTAVKLHIPVAHIEAGLRSGDRSMPEEINRLVTDAISDMLFITERNALENLTKEGISKEKIFFTGNVMIDSLVFLKEKINSSLVLESIGIQARDYFLVTFHRPSNVDNFKSLNELIDFLNEISEFKKVIFPIHPRTLKNIYKFQLERKISTNVHLTEPLGYLDFQSLVSKAFMVITDSGGIQEETTFLSVPCITVRDNTERPVTVDIGTNILCGSDTTQVMKTIKDSITGNLKKGSIPELWDGKAAERIAEILITSL